MHKPTLLRHIALYGISLPTFAISPAVAKATVYMPSHVAARMLGGRAPKPSEESVARGAREESMSSGTPHAA